MLNLLEAGGMKSFLKRFLHSLAAGVVVTLVGAVLSTLFGEWMNGLSRESATLLGLGLYLCFVLVVCTGIILAKLKK
ncbi:MAG: hypothetical protein ACOYJZ_01105 [Acutalibacter sp.]